MKTTANGPYYNNFIYPFLFKFLNYHVALERILYLPFEHDVAISRKLCLSSIKITEASILIVPIQHLSSCANVSPLVFDHKNKMLEKSITSMETVKKQQKQKGAFSMTGRGTKTTKHCDVGTLNGTLNYGKIFFRYLVASKILSLRHLGSF